MNEIFERLRRDIQNRLDEATRIQRNLGEPNNHLLRFYIGKTSDIESARRRHGQEGYTSTVCLYESQDSELISSLEGQLISHFMEESDNPDSPLNGKCGNERGGSAGNPNSDKLYLSMEVRPLRIEDLEIN